MNKFMKHEPLVQGSPAWLQLRKNFLGASDAPTIMGFYNYKTPLQLCLEKWGLSETEENFGMKYGKENEEKARQAFEAKAGILVSPAVVFHSKKPFLMASLDGISMDHKEGVEIKCPNEEVHEIARSGKVPDFYYPQIQQQLACTPSIEKMWYFSWHKGDGILLEVLKDLDYIELMESKEEAFWTKHVMGLLEPDLVDEDYRDKSEDIDWVISAKLLFDVQKKIRELEKLEEDYKQEMIKVSEGKNCIAQSYGMQYRFTAYKQKGNVNYNAIPELTGVDLESYRKPPSTRYKLTSKEMNDGRP